MDEDGAGTGDGDERECWPDFPLLWRGLLCLWEGSEAVRV